MAMGRPAGGLFPHLVLADAGITRGERRCRQRREGVAYARYFCGDHRRDSDVAGAFGRTDDPCIGGVLFHPHAYPGADVVRLFLGRRVDDLVGHYFGRGLY